MRRAALAVTSVALAACLRTPSYHCTGNDQCTINGAPGRCEANGYCSTADSGCGSGFRWASGAPSAGACVGDTGPDAPPGGSTWHDVCQVSGPRNAADSQCVSDVCAQMGRCCTREWSDECVMRAETTCGVSCGAVAAFIGDGHIEVDQWNGTAYAPLWQKATYPNMDDSVAAWGDVNGDKLPDLVTCESQNSNGTDPGKMCIWTNGGTCGEAFCQLKCVDVGGCLQVNWVDIDHDGDLDVAAFGAYTSYLWINDQGLWSSTTFQPWGGSIYQGADFADVDGDGQIDVALAGYETIAHVDRLTLGGSDYVTLGRVWDDTASDPTARHKQMVFGDIDLDGRLDLLITGESLIKAWINTTPGSDGFTTGTTPLYSDPTYDAESAGLVDVDEDGDLDIVVADGGGHLNVLRNNELPGHTPGFTMTPLWTSGTSYNSTRLAFGDVDGDHHVDIVVAHPYATPGSNGASAVFRARGTLGEFGNLDGTPTWFDPAASKWYGVALTGAWK